MLHDLSVGGLFGQQLSSSTLQDGLHGAEAGADPWGEVEVLSLHHASHDRETQAERQTVKGRQSEGHSPEPIQVHFHYSIRSSQYLNL